MCLCDKQFPQETAFAFLEDLRKMFFDTFTPQQIENAIAYSLNTSFKEKIKGRMDYYNRNTNVGDSVSQLKKGVINMKDDVLDASDVLSQRGEKINLIVKKADSLRQESNSFYKSVNMCLTCRLVRYEVLCVGEG
jgi:hypothetical protein